MTNQPRPRLTLIVEAGINGAGQAGQVQDLTLGHRNACADRPPDLRISLPVTLTRQSKGPVRAGRKVAGGMARAFDAKGGPCGRDPDLQIRHAGNLQAVFCHLFWYLGGHRADETAGLAVMRPKPLQQVSHKDKPRRNICRARWGAA